MFSGESTLGSLLPFNSYPQTAQPCRKLNPFSNTKFCLIKILQSSGHFGGYETKRFSLQLGIQQSLAPEGSSVFLCRAQVPANPKPPGGHSCPPHALLRQTCVTLSASRAASPSPASAVLGVRRWGAGSCSLHSLTVVACPENEWNRTHLKSRPRRRDLAE